MASIEPIRTERDHGRALKAIDRLWNSRPGTPEADHLEALAILVEAYEKKHFPIAKPDPIEAIAFRIEQLGYTRKDLEPIIGSKARVREVLNRKRGLTLPMIRRLHEKLCIPVDVLIRPTVKKDVGSRPKKGDTRQRLTKKKATRKKNDLPQTPIIRRRLTACA